jgi:AIPR protein
MAISKQDRQALDQIFSEHNDKYGGRAEDYYALLYLQRKFKCEASVIAHQIAFGNNDYGLDAYYIDREARNLHLYQFKWSENHNLFKESMERLAKSGMERIFGDPLQDPHQNEFLRALRADLYESQELIDRVYMQFIFKGSLDAAENSAGLSERRESLENKKFLLERYFRNRPVTLIVEFVSDERRPPPPPPRDTYQISFSEKVSLRTADGQKVMHVGFLSLFDLHEMYKSLGQRFFDRNVRAGLSPNNPPNIKIREGLSNILVKERISPEVFTFCHNGVTLAAQRLTTENSHATIEVPRLLNGAQTLTSLDKFLEDNRDNPAVRDNQDRLRSIRVLAKIVEYDPWSDFVTTVTICNNQQNPVDPWNLRANDRIQCDLQDKFKEEVGIFYSRQENAFQNLATSELVEMGIEDPRDIKIKPLAQTFLAFQGDIGNMSRMPDVFSNEKTYGDTFRRNYLDSDFRKIVIGYKIHLVLNSPIQRLEERAAIKLGLAIKRARNLIWALLIQAILNEAKLSEKLERFGNSLAKEVDFREYLKSLASAKLLPILRDLFDRDEYRDKIENERYDFLRTKEVFKKCMDSAYDKFGWTKRSL